jgi:hypothetical protein
MAKVSGSFVRLSLPRRMVGDFLSATRNVPLVTGQRTLRLAEVVAARAAARPRPSWAALLAKAVALTCAAQPELRRTFVAWPWARLFQYDTPLVSLVIEREYEGELGLFLGRLKAADRRPLLDLHTAIQDYKSRPVAEIRGFRNALRLAAVPNIVRRPLWRLIMNAMPRLRADLLGTIGISPTTGMRVRGIHIVTPWTIGVHYDMPQDNGDLDVRMTFDHRVYDAAVLARALGEMEQQLRGPILGELRALAEPVRQAA